MKRLESFAAREDAEHCAAMTLLNDPERSGETGSGARVGTEVWEMV